MADSSTTKAIGLSTQYNPLNVTDGTFVQLDNAVIRRENVVENRRGYANYGTLSNTPSQLFPYSNRVLVHNSTTLSYDNGSGTFSSYAGSYSAVSGRKIHSQQANANVYFTTDAGIKILMEVTSPISTTGNTHSNSTLDNLASTTGIVVGQVVTGSGIPANTYVAQISGSTVTMSANASTSLTGTTVVFTPKARPAGAPRVLGMTYTLTGATGFMSDNSQLAYRSLTLRVDQNSNYIYGYPSDRMWVTAVGVGHTTNVAFTVYLSSDHVAGDIIQVYRTVQTSNPTGTNSDIAGDEEGLVYQTTLLQSDILTGSITVTDSVIDALRGATIYTAPSQQGIGQANAEPPLAKDLALYKNTMFYANTQTKQRLFVSMISQVNQYNGGSYAQKIIINGVTFTSDSAENAGTGHYKVFNTGVAASDIDSTARSLVNIINRYSSNTTVYAYYLSGGNDLPGQILLESRSLGASAFTFQVDATTTAVAGDFFPKPPTSPATSPASTSSNAIQKNALFYSKVNELEAVPFLNFFLVGPSNTEILRVQALRDSLIIIKEEGVYRLTGDSPSNFSVIPLDLTSYCKAVNSVSTLANQVFMLSNQGVVSISDTGVQVVSRDIEPNILPLLANSNLSAQTYGVSYESDRSYIISTLTSTSDSVASICYYYNVFTKSWTRWTFAFTAAVVEQNADKLYFSKTSSVIIFRERKAFSSSDYADPEFSITITDIGRVATTCTTNAGNNQITVASATGITIGMSIIAVGIPTNTTVTQINGTTITMDMAATDPGVGVSVNFASDVITFSVSGQTPLAGYTISQNGTEIRTTDISPSAGNYSATMNTVPPISWVTGAATMFPAVQVTAEWNAFTGEAPGFLKALEDIKILTDNISGNDSSTRLTVTFRTDSSNTKSSVVVDNNSSGWGGPWGAMPWGGQSQDFKYRAWPPQNYTYFRILNPGFIHQNAKEKLAVVGWARTYDMVSERTGT